MAEKYYSILTNRGKALEAASSANATAVIIKDFVIGDGDGQPVTPDPGRTTLVREVYRQAISKLEVSPDQVNQWIAHLVIPADVGRFTIREVGVLTDAGELYAIGSCAAIEKPQSGVNVSIQFRLAVNETASIELKVATGDGLFLRQDANLSDVNDKVQSRKNLGLGSLATKNSLSADDVGALPITGGKIDGDVVVKNVLSLGNVGTGAFAGDKPAINIGDSDSGFLGADDGVITVYVNNVPIGKLDGNGLHINQLIVTGSFLQLTGDDRKHIRFGDADGQVRMFIYKDKGGDGVRINNGADGGGDFLLDRNGAFHAPESLHAGGASYVTDGNIHGVCWGGWLSNWIVARMNDAISYAANDAQHRANVAQDNAQNWAYASLVQDIRLAGRGEIITDGIMTEAPGGAVITGGNGNEGNQLGRMYYRYLQKLVNGNWYTVAYV